MRRDAAEHEVKKRQREQQQVSRGRSATAAGTGTGITSAAAAAAAAASVRQLQHLFWDHFSRIFQLYTAPHTPCDVFYQVYMVIVC